MGTTAFRTTDLVVRRGRRRVLHGITASAERGEIVGLLGPSGSGKTTFMRALVGTQHIDAGDADVLGHPPGARALRGRVGYSSQEESAYDDLTVLENVRAFGRVLGLHREAADRVIGMVDLDAQRGVLAGRLSSGQRNRVSLAIALLGDPDLLILDEPTVGLDPVLKRDLWALFRRIADGGTTILVSSHVMDEARRCERLLLLHDGRLIADGPTEAVLGATGAADPEEAFVVLVQRAGGSG